MKFKKQKIYKNNYNYKLMIQKYNFNVKMLNY